jgi:hypothetical protein
MAPFGKQQEILRDLSTSSPEELSGKVGKGIPISPGSNVNGRLQATSLIEPRVQFPNRNSRNKHGKNLPLHPTQFATLEIENENKRHPSGGVFHFRVQVPRIS